jgi:hypothetical protein
MKKLNLLFCILSLLLIFLTILVNLNYTLFLLIPLLSFYLITTNKLDYFLGLCLAFCVSLIWNLLAGSQYYYNLNFTKFLGTNIYTLVAWTIGLFALLIIYNLFIKKIKLKGFLSNFLVVFLVYSIILILLETIFYHNFNVHNLRAAIYPGLPICNCLHAPRWMQISYFLIGPIYFTFYYLLYLRHNP